MEVFIRTIVLITHLAVTVMLTYYITDTISLRISIWIVLFSGLVFFILLVLMLAHIVSFIKFLKRKVS